MPNDLATPPQVTQAARLSPVHDSGEFAQLLDSDRFAQIQRVAKMFSESDLIPEVFKGKPANCAVALQMAFRMHIDPMMLMQNMYIVHGRPGIEAKLAIALINSRGPFKGPLKWRFEGQPGAKDRACVCYQVHKITGETCESRITWAMVEAEGWLSKTGSKWKTMPDQMFQYRSAMFLGRLHCPEVLLGLPTAEELYDVGGERVVVGEVVESTPIANINAAIAGKPAPIDVEETETRKEPPAEQAKPSGHAFTFAQVSAAINEAKSKEGFDLARDMIRSVTDQRQRAELEIEALAKSKTIPEAK